MDDTKGEPPREQFDAYQKSTKFAVFKDAIFTEKFLQWAKQNFDNSTSEEKQMSKTIEQDFINLLDEKYPDVKEEIVTLTLMYTLLDRMNESLLLIWK